MILTLPDHDERRRIINKMHRTKDKDLCRRLNAILLLADGHSVSAVSRLTAAARSSINRWVNWYTLFGLEGLESEPRGRKPVLLAGLGVFGAPTSPSCDSFARGARRAAGTRPR